MKNQVNIPETARAIDGILGDAVLDVNDQAAEERLNNLLDLSEKVQDNPDNIKDVQKYTQDARQLSEICENVLDIKNGSALDGFLDNLKNHLNKNGLSSQAKKEKPHEAKKSLTVGVKDKEVFKKLNHALKAQTSELARNLKDAIVFGLGGGKNVVKSQKDVKAFTQAVNKYFGRKRRRSAE